MKLNPLYLTRYASFKTIIHTTNLLRPNPTKTQISVFHLKNRHANVKLNVSWNGVELEHVVNPVYLGVTLDRSLTYKSHCEKVRKKISTRNSLLRKLTGTSWGANANTLRTTAMALCFSTAEYCCPVWERSTHSKEVDVALYETLRMITGCISSTPTQDLSTLSGIAPPHIRRSTLAQKERLKQTTDSRHNLYPHEPVSARLPSRKSFVRTVTPLNDTLKTVRRNKWIGAWSENSNNSNLKNFNIDPTESLPLGYNLPWPVRRTANRIRSGHAATPAAKCDWGYQQSSVCQCGAPRCDIDHLLNDCDYYGTRPTNTDITSMNDNAIRWMAKVADTIWWWTYLKFDIVRFKMVAELQRCES